MKYLTCLRHRTDRFPSTATTPLSSKVGQGSDCAGVLLQLHMPLLMCTGSRDACSNCCACRPRWNRQEAEAFVQVWSLFCRLICSSLGRSRQGAESFVSSSNDLVESIEIESLLSFSQCHFQTYIVSTSAYRSLNIHVLQLTVEVVLCR